MTKSICSVEGCGKVAVARGWCGAHYARWRKHGDPMLVQRFGYDRPFATFEDRFWSKVDVGHPLGCWQWIGYVGAYGYGYVTRDDKRPLAHRVAYELLREPVPDGLHLDHLCRNHGCVNPDHLEPVSCKVNLHRGYGPTRKHSEKTHCIRGHEFTPGNIYVGSKGGRVCKECRRMYERNRKRTPTEQSREKAREATRRYRARQKAREA